MKRFISFLTALSMTLMIFGIYPVSAYDVHIHKVCANLSHKNCTHSENIEYEPFSFDSMSIKSDKNYYLTDDIDDNTLKNGYMYINGATVNFCLNGHSVDTKGIIVRNNGTLNICDCQGGGCMKNTLHTSGVVIADPNGKINIYGGRIRAENGMAIHCGDDGVTNIYDGEISTGNGGCIMVGNRSALSIYGGTVQSGTEGSGIDIADNSTVNINGGTINGEEQGILANYRNSTVNINGGSITGTNLAAVFLQNGSVCNINGGTVTGINHSAVYALESGIANISGGNVIGGAAYPTVWSGNEGTVNISNGRISNSGYNSYIWNNGTLNISGGTFSKDSGNGYIRNYGSFSLQGSPSLENTGIWLYNDNNITISGTLTNNAAYKIYVSSSVPRTFTSGWDTHMSDSNVSKYFSSPYDYIKIAYRDGEAVKTYYYNITYDANGGSCSVQTVSADASDKLASLAVPTRDGYSFVGWFTEENGGVQITADTVFTNDTTIYAHWTCIDHDYGSWTITEEPTLTETGEAERVCANDSTHKEKEFLPVLTDTSVWTKDETQHIEPTEENTGKDVYTSEYGEVEITLPPKMHTHTLDKTEEKAASCTEDGNEAYWTCSVCHKMFSDENGTIEITAVPTISSTGHAFAAEWSNNETNHWHTAICEHIDEKRDEAVHAWNNGVVTIEPTEEAEGEKTYTCTVCNYTKTEIIPKLDITDTETTPDVTEPPVTDPSDTGSTGTEPPVTDPSDTGSAGTEPPVTEPSDTEPIVTVPPVTEPPITESIVTVPPVTEPIVTAPPVTEPPVTEPVITAPPYIPYFPPNNTAAAAVPIQREPYLQNENGKIGWDVISDNIWETPDGETVHVNMNGTVELPKNIVSDISGRDIDLVLIMNGGFVWTINGMSVTKAKTVDMSVRKRSVIPQSTVKGFAGNAQTVQLDLRHNGDLGFIAKLTVYLGNRYSGMYANSYCYKSRNFEFGDSSEIAEGYANLRFTHASSWLITIDDFPALEDVSTGAAAHSAGTPIDMTNSASSINIPDFIDERKFRLSNKKRRYRILKKRRLDDLVFVF